MNTSDKRGSTDPEPSEDGGLAETERRHSAHCRAEEARRTREAEILAAGFDLGKAAVGRLPALDALQLHRCKICGTRWLLWPDMIHGGGWNLLDRYQRPGGCCDNVAMGDQIEHLRDLPLAGLRADPAPLQMIEEKDV